MHQTPYYSQLLSQVAPRRRPPKPESLVATRTSQGQAGSQKWVRGWNRLMGSQRDRPECRQLRNRRDVSRDL